jgi:hypothetical protein
VTDGPTVLYSKFVMLIWEGRISFLPEKR